MNETVANIFVLGLALQTELDQIPPLLQRY